MSAAIKPTESVSYQSNESDTILTMQNAQNHFRAVVDAVARGERLKGHAAAIG